MYIRGYIIRFVTIPMVVMLYRPGVVEVLCLEIKRIGRENLDGEILTYIYLRSVRNQR